MSNGSKKLHEPAGRLTDETVDIHRALLSLQEELEAVDWYRQRADACRDQTLREILEHNMNEEIEHAAMLLEWLRRSNAEFARQLGTYLNTTGPIIELEERDTKDTQQQPAVDSPGERSQRARPSPSTVGPMKEAQ